MLWRLEVFRYPTPYTGFRVPDKEIVAAGFKKERQLLPTYVWFTIQNFRQVTNQYISLFDTEFCIFSKYNEIFISLLSIEAHRSVFF